MRSLDNRVRRLETHYGGAAAWQPDPSAGERACPKFRRVVELYPPQSPPSPNASLAEQVAGSIAAHPEL